MADIKQAAQWMKEGKRARRRSWMGDVPSWRLDPDDDDTEWADVVEENANPYGASMVAISDLLADDWEIAE